MAGKLGLTNEIKEIKLGRSFGKNQTPQSFHTFRYDFMPASLDTTKRATVDIGEGHQVTVTVPHIEGSGTAHTVFKGSKKPYSKECVLIIDHDTGEITLEKLTYNVQLKDTRGAFKPDSRRSNTPIENGFNGKKSPMSYNKPSPQQKPHSTSFERASPVRKCSPLPKSPVNNLPSPSNSSNHSMPSLSNLTSKPAVTTETPTFHLPGEEIDPPPVGVLSSSSSSGSSSSDESSDSSSSDNEEMATVPKPPPPAVTNGFHQSPKKKEAPTPFSPCNNLSMPTASSLPSMPKFSLLNEDLQLSEDSDSD